MDVVEKKVVTATAGSGSELLAFDIREQRIIRSLFRWNGYCVCILAVTDG